MRFTSWWNTRSQRLGKGHKSNHVNNVHQEGPEFNSCPGGRVLKSDKGPFLDGAEWEAKRNQHFCGHVGSSASLQRVLRFAGSRIERRTQVLILSSKACNASHTRAYEASPCQREIVSWAIRCEHEFKGI